jgi:hypothetical protein
MLTFNAWALHDETICMKQILFTLVQYMIDDEEQYSERFEICVILRYIFLLEVNIFSCSFDSKGQYGTYFFYTGQCHPI